MSNFIDIFLERILLFFMLCLSFMFILVGGALGDDTRPAKNTRFENLVGRNVSRYSWRPSLAEPPAGTPDEVYAKSQQREPGKSWNVELVSHWAAGANWGGVETVGDTFICANGGYFEIYDLADPSNPIFLGKTTLPSQIYRMQRRDHLVYVADNLGGLQVVDISDFRNPMVVGVIDTLGRVFDVKIAGNHAFAWSYDRGLIIIDITNPIDPNEIGRYGALKNMILESEISVSGHYVFGETTDSLRIIDISDPTNPYQASALALSSTYNVYDIDIDGNYAYLAQGGVGLIIIDITDPLNPIELSTYDTPGSCLGVSVSGAYAYVGDYSKGLRIIDVSDAENPEEVGFIEEPYKLRDLMVSGDRVYGAADREANYVIDISNRSAPTILWQKETGWYSHSVSMYGYYAFVAQESEPIKVVDFHDLSNPVEVNQISGLRYLYQIFGQDGYVYAPSHYGLTIIDVSSPRNPVVLVDTYPQIRYLVTCVIDGNIAFARTEDYDGYLLYVLDITDRSAPVSLGSYDLWSRGQDSEMAVSGDYLYIPDAVGQYIDIYDKSNPSNLVLVGTYYVGSIYGYCGIDVSGGYIYLATWANGFMVLDARDHSYITLEGFTDGRFRDVEVEGSYAYLAGENGFQVFDVSDPSNLQEVGYYVTGDDAMRLDVWWNYICLADHNDGVYVFRNTFLPSVAVAIQVFEAVPLDGGVELTWEVNSDGDLDGFDILRSTDGSEAFEQINAVRLPPSARIYHDRTAESGKTYQYRLIAYDQKGYEFPSQVASITTAPAFFYLAQNVPNPFNPSTTISFGLRTPDRVSLNVYDALGRLVKRLVDDKCSAGIHNIVWDGTNEKGAPVNSGVYFYRLKAGKRAETKKMVMLK